jgi:hypothetical protein
LLQGIAYGLQFSESQPSLCYIAISTSLLSSNELLTKFYHVLIPTKTADYLLVASDNANAVAAVACNCNLQGLIDAITKAAGEGISSTLASLGGAVLFELGPIMSGITGSEFDS